MYAMQNSAMREKEVPPFGTTWMDFEGILLSDISQTEKGKLCMTSLKTRI